MLIITNNYGEGDPPKYGFIPSHLDIFKVTTKIFCKMFFEIFYRLT